MHVNIIAVPGVVPLDLVGPYEVFSRVPGWSVNLVAAELTPVVSDKGLAFLPDCTRKTAKPCGLLVIPGGAGADIAMLDETWLSFIRDHAQQAQYVLGVCTGALLLGAAGLLKGKRAGSHWQARDLLALFDAIPSDERIVADGKYYTSAGVTSGIDAALKVVADIEGEERARIIQLAMEYAPAPPFGGGTPITSPPEIVARVREASAARRAERERRVIEAADRLKNDPTV
ncbi:MAG: DJ-1/PfpI family protein [Alphaproteobacteria bacterium]